MALGWLMIVFIAVRVLLSAMTFSGKDPQLISTLDPVMAVLEYLSGFSVSLMMIANFAQIMNNDGEYKQLLISNGLAAVAVFGVSWLLFSRYAVGTLSMAVTEPEQLMPRLEVFFRKHYKAGFLSFNIFLDLFLCTLTMYCLNARPKRFFTGKRIILLRLVALLPIAYEVASLWLKILSVAGRIDLPFWAFPMLTVKPPIAYALFVCMAIHFRGREYRFCRYGRTHREYLDYLQSNRNSLHFSIYLAVGLLIAPLMLRFSYNRAPRWKKLDSIMAPAALFTMVLMLLEAFRIVAGELLQKHPVDLNQVDEWLQMIRSLIG